jgi:four helix bundle protein
MSTETERHGVCGLVAFEVALSVIGEIRGSVLRVRRQDGDLAKQLTRAASSIAANLAEGSRRVGKDRLHFFRIAAGSAEETRAHLRVAVAWGYLQGGDIERALGLLDRQLRLLWGLTH